MRTDGTHSKDRPGFRFPEDWWPWKRLGEINGADWSGANVPGQAVFGG
jgi:hypothetical protein